MGLIHSPNIIRDGLMLHLDAANVKSYPGSGTLWKDLSGNGRHATLRGTSPASFDSQNKGVLDFAPSNASYATIDHDSEISSAVFDSSDNFTLCGWVYVQSYISYGTLINKANGGSYSNTTNGIWIENTSRRIAGVSATAENSNPSGSLIYPDYGSSNAETNRWYHVTYCGDGITARLYINGVQVNSSNFSNITRTRGSTTNPIVIGARNANTNYTLSHSAELDSFVSSISAYGRGLSSEEINQNFNAYRDRYGI